MREKGRREGEEGREGGTEARSQEGRCLRCPAERRPSKPVKGPTGGNHSSDSTTALVNLF